MAGTPPAPRWRTTPRKQAQEFASEHMRARRLALLRLIIVLVFCALVLQLVRVQILQGPRYRLLAQDNLIKVIPSLPARGLIYDRYGRPLVQNVPSFSVSLTPSDIPKGQEENVYTAVAANLGKPAGVIEQTVTDALKYRTPDQPVTVASQIDQTAALKLAELRSTIPALSVTTTASRYYPDGQLMSQILGYVGKLNSQDYQALKSKGYQIDDQEGKAGLEASYESKLRGTPGQDTVEVDAAGHELRTLAVDPPQSGDNLTLTIDSTLQAGLTKILADSLNQYHSPSGVAIMMDVHTGAILAYASLPTYDDNIFSAPIPNAVWQGLLNDPGHPLVDHAIEDRYPPGSAFKEVTGLAALQEGVATANTTITSHGQLLVPRPGGGNDVFPDWADLGTLDFVRGVAMSSDVYFYCLSGGCPQLPNPGLGPDRIAKYARMFGLGEKTGIDLPGEVPGTIPDTQWKLKKGLGQWLLGDTYYYGIGQGYVQVTPIQMLRVVAAVANGGKVLVPHIVSQVRDQNGNLIQSNETQVERQVAVSPQNFQLMREGMREVVINGSATTGFVPGVQIAGKSGTAEYGSPLSAAHAGEQANGSYKEHGWFVSYAPFNNPQVALVVFDQVGGGALTAAPTPSKIWDYYFHQYLPNLANETRFLPAPGTTSVPSGATPTVALPSQQRAAPTP